MVVYISAGTILRIGYQENSLKKHLSRFVTVNALKRVFRGSSTDFLTSPSRCSITSFSLILMAPKIEFSSSVSFRLILGWNNNQSWERVFKPLARQMCAIYWTLSTMLCMPILILIGIVKMTFLFGWAGFPRFLMWVIFHK